MQIKIPDATPAIITKYSNFQQSQSCHCYFSLAFTNQVGLLYSSGDEQALLTKIRYNRFMDVFLGITTYFLQNLPKNYCYRDESGKNR